MKRVRVLIAFLTGILPAVAGSTVEKYQDPLTHYTITRLKIGVHYEVFEEDSNELVSSFTLERIAGKVLLKDFSIPESSKDESGLQSLVTILGYLENKGYAIFGPESAFFLSDYEENKSFYASNGFALLSEVPDFLVSSVGSDEVIYKREAQAPFQVTDGNGFEDYIDR